MDDSAAHKSKNIAWVNIFYNKIIDALQLYIAMSISAALLGNALIGGAICLLGQVIVVFIRLFNKENSILLPGNIHIYGILLLVGVTILNIVLVFIYPSTANSMFFGIFILCIVLLLLRQILTYIINNYLNFKRFPKTLLLLIMQSLFTTSLALLLYGYLSADNFVNIVTMLSATSIAMLAYRENLKTHNKQAPKIKGDKLINISSYRLYNRMAANTIAALNISLTTYICYIQLEIDSDAISVFWNLIIWLIMVFGATAVFYQFLKRKGYTQYDKPSVFLFGAILISLAITGSFKGWFTGVFYIIGNLMWGAGLACMLAIIISMNANIRYVLEFNMPEEDISGYEANTNAIIEWNLTLFTFLIVILLCVMTFLTERDFYFIRNKPFITQVFKWILTLPPMLILVALIDALRQPLDRDYEKKLAKYQSQQRKGNINPDFEARLQLKLVKQTRTIIPRILIALIKPLMPSKVIGAENVKEDDVPIIFVCNHLVVYGPIITNLHLPFYFRSWIISGMLNKDIIAKQLVGGVNSVLKWIPKFIRDKLPRILAPFILYVLTSLDPIPVFRGNMREVLSTLRLTVDAMEYGDNILLFPENPNNNEDGHYKLDGVSPFFQGFANIGSDYYKRTGGCTVFYPVYVDKTEKTITIGEGITFDPNNKRNIEKQRIVDYLYAWMSKQS